MANTTFSGPVRSLNGFISFGPKAVVSLTADTTLTVATHAGRVLTCNDADGKFTLPSITSGSSSAVAGVSTAGPARRVCSMRPVSLRLKCPRRRAKWRSRSISPRGSKSTTSFSSGTLTLQVRRAGCNNASKTSATTAARLMATSASAPRRRSRPSSVRKGLSPPASWTPTRKPD